MGVSCELVPVPLVILNGSERPFTATSKPRCRLMTPLLRVSMPPMGRITKRTGDERSKPEKSKGGAWDPTRPLSNKAARHLKGLGHHLERSI